MRPVARKATLPRLNSGLPSWRVSAGALLWIDPLANQILKNSVDNYKTNVLRILQEHMDGSFEPETIAQRYVVSSVKGFEINP